MSIIQFETGQRVKFDGNPTPQDVEEVANRLGINKPTKQPNKQPGFLGGVGSFLKSRFTQAPAGFGRGATPEEQVQAITGFINPEAGAIRAGETQLQKLAPKLLKGAEEKVGKILSPTTKSLKQLTKKIAPEFVEKAPFFLSLKGLLSKAESKITQFGQAIGEKFDLLPPEGKDALTPILKRITQFQDNLAIKGTDIIPEVNAVEHQALSNLKNELVNIAKNTQEIPTASLRSYLKELDNMIEKAGKGFGFSLADSAKLLAQKTLANTIRDEMAKARPDIAKLNREYTFWKRVQKIGQATLERKTGQVGGLRKPIARVAGEVVGVGGGPVISVITGEVAAKFQSFFDSALYHRVAMGTKKKVADLLASGKVDDALKILEKAIISVQSSKGETR